MLSQHDDITLVDNTKKIYYAIKKHMLHFEEQIKDLQLGKKQKISKKSAVFLQASLLSTEVRTALSDHEYLKADVNIGINSVLNMLLFKNEEELFDILGSHLNDRNLFKLPLEADESNYYGGKFANALIKEVDDNIEEHFKALISITT